MLLTWFPKAKTRERGAGLSTALHPEAGPRAHTRGSGSANYYLEHPPSILEVPFNFFHHTLLSLMIVVF